MTPYDYDAIADQKVGLGIVAPAAGRKPRRLRDQRPLFDRWADPRGSSTNSPVGNSQGAGGDDWLDVACYVDWKDHQWINLGTLLNGCQLAARMKNDARSFFELDGHHVKVFESGSKKAGGPQYRWRIECRGVILEIMNRQKPPGGEVEAPNVLVHVGGLALLGYGSFDEPWLIAQWIIRELGGVLQREIVSRWDCCADVVDQDVTEFVEAYIGESYVSRARSGQLHDDGSGGGSIHRRSRKWTGITVGGPSAPIKMRVYDKLEETKNNPEKRALMVARRWGGVLPDKATRVEFQLRRQALKSLGVDRVQDLVKKRADVVRYLTSEWIRFVGCITDRTHTTRTIDSEAWCRVRKAFEWAGNQAKKIARKFVRRRDTSALVVQSLGCLKSAVAGCVGIVADAGEFLAVAYDLIEAAVLHDVVGTLRGVQVRALGLATAGYQNGRMPCGAE